MTVLFDRLSYMDRLTAGGVTEGQARLHADALDLALREAVVTKPDLDEAIQALRHDLEEVTGKLRSDFETANQALRHDLEASVRALRSDFDKAIQVLRGEFGQRFQAHDERLSRIEHRLDMIEHRLEEMEGRIDLKMDMKIAALEQKMTIRVGAMMAVSVGILSVLITVF